MGIEDQIWEDHLRGVSYRELAKKYHKSYRDISRIIRSRRGSAADAELVRRVGEIEGRLGDIEKKIEQLELSLSLRFIGRYRCKNMDENGYCTYWRLKNPIEGYEDLMVSDGEGWLLKVDTEETRWVCALCPSYEPRG